MAKQAAGQLDIFSALEEIENGPPACTHAPNVKSGFGFTLEYNPKSEYYLEWVHSDPSCRRSKIPGRKEQKCLHLLRSSEKA